MYSHELKPYSIDYEITVDINEAIDQDTTRKIGSRTDKKQAIILAPCQEMAILWVNEHNKFYNCQIIGSEPLKDVIVGIISDIYGAHL